MYNVVIVDDDKIARQGFIKTIPWERYNMRIVGDFPNAISTLTALQDQMVDLLIVDMQMPIMNGLELIKKCKELYPFLHYVVLSFYEDFELVQSALRLGVLDYLSKARLDSAEVDLVFTKVSEILGKAKIVHTNDYIVSDRDEPDIIEYNHIEHWKNLYWIYCNDVFEDMCLELHSLEPCLRTLDRLIMMVISEVEDRFNVDLQPVFHHQNVDEVITVLRTLKDTLYKIIQNQDEIHTTDQSILMSVIIMKKTLGNTNRSDQIAAKVNMSRSYFCTCFKRLTSRSYNSFLQRERVFMAQKLLRTSNKSVDEIVQEVGYEDKHYFASLYQELLGCSMLDIQKTH